MAKLCDAAGALNPETRGGAKGFPGDRGLDADMTPSFAERAPGGTGAEMSSTTDMRSDNGSLAKGGRVVSNADATPKGMTRTGARKRNAIAVASARAATSDSVGGAHHPNDGCTTNVANAAANDTTAVEQRLLTRLPSENKVGKGVSGRGGGRRRRRRGSTRQTVRVVGSGAHGGEVAMLADEVDRSEVVDGKGDGAGLILEGEDVAGGQAEDMCEEDDEGNVEYKLKLVNPPLDRLEHLFTQMNWRLNEGRGVCMYMLGYEDDGKATGISPSELSASIKTLRVMMKAVGAKISNMEVQATAGKKKLKVARVTVVRQAAVLDGLPPGSERRGLRIGVLGHAGAGKSTLVGVLTRGLSDNGRGLARMQVFRHNHEVFNGQTSSISQQALTLPLAHGEMAAGSRRSRGGGGGGGGAGGIELRRNVGGVASAVEISGLSASFPRSSRLGGASASNGFASAWARGRRRGDSLDESGSRALRFDGTCEEEEGARVLTFIDQPGHEKYLKTTLTGMTGSALDYAMLVVSGVAGVQRMTREHLAIALALQLPLFVVVTKADVADTVPPGTPKSLPLESQPQAPATASTAMDLAVQGLDKVLWASMGKRTKVVGGVDDAERAADALKGGQGAAGASWDGLVPVMQVSSVTSDGFAELRAFLSRMGPPEPLEAMYKEARGKAAEVRISDTFMVEGVGEVYAGTVVSGTVSVGDRLLLGPTGPDGIFVRTAVVSVHVARLAVRRASAGQTASFTLTVDPEEEDDGDANASNPMADTSAGFDVDGRSNFGSIARSDPDDGSASGNRRGKKITTSMGQNPKNEACDAGSEELIGVDEEMNDFKEGVSGPSTEAVDRKGRGANADSTCDGPQDATAPDEPVLYEGGVGLCEGESPGKRIRKGMVLVEATSRPNTSYEFEAEVMILHHPGVIRQNYQPVVHAHNICQSACITSLVQSTKAEVSNDGDVASTGIKSGGRAICRFRFLYRPEYLSVGTTIVLREGRTRGFGKVISVQ